MLGFAGIYGLIAFFRLIDGLEYQAWALYLSVTVFGGLLQWIYFCKHRFIGWFGAGFAAGYAAYCFFRRDSLSFQFRQITGCVWGNSAQTAEVTEALLIFSLLLAFLLILLELRFRRHWILYLFTTFLLLAAPMFQMQASLGDILLLLVFQIGFFAFHSAGRDRKNRKKALYWTPPEEKNGFFALGLIIAVFFAALLVTACWREPMFRFVYDAEGAVYRTVSSLSGMSGRLAHDGAISRGNNYRTGTELLEISTADRPTETLYLKGFTGGTYTDSRWLPADETEMRDRITEALEWQEWRNMVDGMLNTMYFVMNRYTNFEEPPRQMMLRYLTEDRSGIYIPYFGVLRSGRMDASGFAYQYYETNQVLIDWNIRERDRRESTLEWYKELHDAYREQVQIDYTQVERGNFPQLSRLCAEHPLDDLGSITDFIRTTLHDRAAYSLTPGRIP